MTSWSSAWWLRTLPRLRVHHLRDLADAQIALVEAELLVRRRPLGQLIAAHDKHDAPPPTLAQGSEAMRLARAVRRVARHGLVRPPCLTRALALHRLLERRGIRGSTVRIGVRRDHGVFAAHAWVDLGGAVLGDAASNAATFVVLAESRLASRRRA